ncbi:MAG TPA: sulfatase-like hydrolase/transferase, partial [Vicinamibacterales bacterium]|nr:sulfatase-like hydrolase/transferase [Vicinamibacterales bacterium]
PAGHRLGVDGWTGTVVLAAAVVGVVCAAWVRLQAFRTFATLTSAAVLVVPAVFLTAPGIRPLIWHAPDQSLVEGVETSAPVVVLVFDELPLVSLLDARGQIDGRRFPSLARLASDGIWYPNAMASSDYTRWSLPALLTGERPVPDSTPIFDHHPGNLFTLLGASHRIEALEPITALCPRRLCAQDERDLPTRLWRLAADLGVVSGHLFLPPDARAELPSLTANWADFGREPDSDDDRDRPLWRRIWDQRIDENHARSALRFVDGVGGDDPQPTLYFMHTLATHHPLRWLPSGQAVQHPRRVPGLVNDRWTKDDAWPTVQFQHGHLVQAGLVETIVGGILERLDAAGLYDDALVVVTSDHGISFIPGDELRSVTDANAGDIISVPLIVKLPRGRYDDRRGIVDDRLVAGIDVLPTIADGLGITLPWPVDGRSALGPERRQSARVWVRDEERMREYNADQLAAIRAEALSRKTARFGDTASPDARPPGLERLSGTMVTSHTILPSSGGMRVHVDRPYALGRVDLNGPALPVQITGRIEPAASANGDPLALAIAVNGVIAATTQTWRGQAGWMALLPPDVLRDGRNELDVFAVDRTSGLRLVRLPRTTPDPRGINLLFAGFADWGVELDGLYEHERSGRTRFRWTNGAASIAIPLPDGIVPKSVELDVRSTGPKWKRIRVLVDECEAASETVGPGAASLELPLDRCPRPRDRMHLRIVSETHRLERDTRQLGVALTRAAIE